MVKRTSRKESKKGEHEMSVASATPAQLKQLDDFVVLQRSACVKIWQLNKTINALVSAWNANVLGIIGAPAGTPIADSTGYAGAVQLTDTQVTNLIGIMQAFQTGTMTAGNQTVFTLATGPDNML
jgi:hypothetical protein